MGRWRAPLVSALVVGLCIGSLSFLPGDASAAPGATLRVDPPTVSVGGGETFKVSIIQNAPIPTVGYQTNLAFDPKLVQIKAMEPGPAYADGRFAYGSADDGSNKTVAAAIAKANSSGVLKSVAAFLLPGSGSVPAGDAVALVVTMQAKAGASGTSRLDLKPLLPKSPIQMLDEDGNLVAVTTKGGSVKVSGSASPSATPTPVASASLPAPTPSAAATPTPGASASPSATPTPVATPTPTPVTTPPAEATATPTGEALGSVSGPIALTVAAASSQVDRGASTSIDLRYRSGAQAGSIVADLTFDNKVLQITKIEPGPDWSEATVVAGSSGLTLDQAIAQANQTGALKQVGVFLPGSSEASPGEGVFLSVTVTGLEDGTSALTLANAAVLDSQGAPLPVTVDSASAELIVGTGGGGIDPLLIVGLIIVVALIAGGSLLAWSRRGSGA